MTSGGTPPPTPMKKQKARPPRPPSLQPLPPLPCLSPRGGAWNDRWPLGRGGGGHEGSLSGATTRLFPTSFHHLAAGSELGTQGMERVWDLALRQPLPHRVPCSPRGGGQRRRAARADGLGEGREGKREGRSRYPPRGPSATCPPPPTAAPPTPRAAARAALSAPFAPRCP